MHPKRRLLLVCCASKERRESLWPVCLISSRVSKVEDRVDGHDKASKELVSLYTMHAATERPYAAPPPECMRSKGCESE